MTPIEKNVEISLETQVKQLRDIVRLTCDLLNRDVEFKGGYKVLAQDMLLAGNTLKHYAGRYNSGLRWIEEHRVG